MATPLEPADNSDVQQTGRKKKMYPLEAVHAAGAHRRKVLQQLPCWGRLMVGSVTQRQHYHSPTHISMPSPPALTAYSWSHSLLSTLNWLTVHVPGQGIAF